MKLWIVICFNVIITRSQNILILFRTKTSKIRSCRHGSFQCRFWCYGFDVCLYHCRTSKNLMICHRSFYEKKSIFADGNWNNVPKNTKTKTSDATIQIVVGKQSEANFYLKLLFSQPYDKPSMNFDIDNFLVQAYSRQFKELNKSSGKLSA